MVTRTTRPIRRETSAWVYSGGRRRAVIVEILPPGDVLRFRLKGTRRVYTLLTAWAFQEAGRQYVANLRAERAAERKLRRAAR